MNTIYKICTASEWREAERAGVYRGSAADHKDGFIHFSTAEQAAETAAKWFSGQRDLVLVAVDADALGDTLKWEPSRGGAIAPATIHAVFHRTHQPRLHAHAEP